MAKADLILHFKNGDQVKGCSNGKPFYEIQQEYPIGKNILKVNCYGETQKRFECLKSIEILTDKEDDQC